MWDNEQTESLKKLGLGFKKKKKNLGLIEFWTEPYLTKPGPNQILPIKLIFEFTSKTLSLFGSSESSDEMYHIKNCYSFNIRFKNPMIRGYFLNIFQLMWKLDYFVISTNTNPMLLTEPLAQHVRNIIISHWSLKFEHTYWYEFKSSKSTLSLTAL